MKKLYLKNSSLAFLLTFIISNINAQSSFRIGTGSEMANFSTLDLASSGVQTWTTDRLSTPGYFSAKIGAFFTGATDSSNINGYLKKYGNELYTFPVGSGTDLRTLTMSAPSLITDAYATAWIPGDPSGNADPTGPDGGPHDINSRTSPITTVSNVGQWDWQTGIDLGATGNGAGLTITVSIPDMTAFSTTAGLRLVGWNGTDWVDLSGSPTATGTAINSTLSGTMVAGISAIGIGSIDLPLPVKLVSFIAQNSGCNAVLNWTTANEQNMSDFEIEQSDDGSVFHSAGVVSTKGNNQSNNYSFTLNQSSVINYYRLKIIDINGYYTYSSVTMVKTNCAIKSEIITVYPNPVKNGIVSISFTSPINNAAKLMLINESGQTFISMDMAINAGTNLAKLQLNQIPKGTYLIKLVSTGNKFAFQAQKIIVQ